MMVLFASSSRVVQTAGCWGFRFDLWRPICGNLLHLVLTLLEFKKLLIESLDSSRITIFRSSFISSDGICGIHDAPFAYRG